ncbi:MAG: ESX-1 secretion-associated protein [Mycobacterium kyogaense]|uniref:ESX-1 secretion-associated protein n=1 Tax=Mycobacterium kyogaense TaxID=2212479 RepID=UPI002FFBEBDC
MSVDTEAVRSYGRAADAHADALHTAAAHLTGATDGANAYGPVGARFLASLARAAGDDAAALASLGVSLAGARTAADASAQSYDAAESDAANRIAFW